MKILKYFPGVPIRSLCLHGLWGWGGGRGGGPRPGLIRFDIQRWSNSLYQSSTSTHVNGFHLSRLFSEHNITETPGSVGVLIPDLCLHLVIFTLFFPEENKVLKKENSRFQKREKKTEESLTKAQVGLLRLSEVTKVMLSKGQGSSL